MVLLHQEVLPPRCKYSPSAYAGSGFWLNANSKRQAQHHVLPNCGRKPAPSSCEPTPRLPPELLPEDLWWAPSPGCPPPTPGKEVRPVLEVKTPFWDQGRRQWRDVQWVFILIAIDCGAVLWSVLNNNNLVGMKTTISCSIGISDVWFIWKPRNIRKSESSLQLFHNYQFQCFWGLYGNSDDNSAILRRGNCQASQRCNIICRQYEHVATVRFRFVDNI